jgi:EAL domain-containing protein (putative c-di-GMP-specific phosphodiesterase class I)
MQDIEKDECVARLGGDNFVAVIRKENAEAYIHRISNMELVYQDGEKRRKFSFGATIGVSELENIHEPGDVMARISSAYQAARQRDSKDVVYFSEEIHKEIMRQKEVIAGFYQGISRQEFEVYYQPKVNTRERKLCGAEALIRWKRQGKMISPMEFIPILEKEGSICILDFYVLDKVCEFLSMCIRESRPVYTISVNFSKRHMENPHLAQEIVEVIDKYNVPHEYIEVELTESEDVKDYIVLANPIDNLRSAGVCASVDDFGTGYSSLNMLKMINTDILKIDKSFIPFGRGESDNQKDCIMFESILKLAKALGFQIVAEGVETEQQFNYMHEVGCDIIQGYYFDRPLPKDEFLERLANGQY